MELLNKNGEIKNTTVYLTNPDVVKDYLTIQDLHLFVKCFTEVIRIILPKMASLKNYTKEIVKICMMLGMAIPWVLPSGAIISQSYLKASTLKIRPFAFIK